MVLRRILFGASAFAALATACASIVGVDEPVLDPTVTGPGGSSGPDGSTAAVRCTADTDCTTAARYCETARGACVACKIDAHCAPGEKCTASGACAETCGAGKACGAPQLCCAGACSSTLSDPSNCGACGTACSTLNIAATACTTGTCAFDCKPGFAHCKQTNTGCETETASNVLSCGSCTNDCNEKVKNANGVRCTASKCDYATCKQYFVDKNGDRADGCEATCGGKDEPCCAGNACKPGMSLQCQQGTCQES